MPLSSLLIFENAIHFERLLSTFRPSFDFYLTFPYFSKNRNPGNP